MGSLDRKGKEDETIVIRGFRVQKRADGGTGEAVCTLVRTRV